MGTDTAADVELLAQQLYPRLEAELPEVSGDPSNVPILRRLIERALTARDALPEPAVRTKLIDRLLAEHVGLGPLEALLQDLDITDIQVVGWDRVWVERHGRRERAALAFWGEAQLRRILGRLAGRAGRHVDERTPVLVVRLPDGSRITAIVPPAAVEGAVLTIRKFLRRYASPQELVRNGMLSDAMLDVLRAAVVNHTNIIISGPAGSGKTTLLNVLASFIPPDERVVTIEDVAELHLSLPNWTRLEVPPSSGNGELSQRTLLRAALRLRPDRLIVGEVCGVEALEMLQVMHAGHCGSMSTLNAGSARNALARLEVLALGAGLELSNRAVREMIADAVDLVVCMALLPDGRRIVAEVAEVTGMQGDVIQMQPLFTHAAAQGTHEWTGIAPQFLDSEPAAQLPAFSRLRRAQQSRG